MGMETRDKDRAGDLDLEELPVPSAPQWDFSRCRGHPHWAFWAFSFLTDTLSQTRPRSLLTEKVPWKGVCAPLSRERDRTYPQGGK